MWALPPSRLSLKRLTPSSKFITHIHAQKRHDRLLHTRQSRSCLSSIPQLTSPMRRFRLNPEEQRGLLLLILLILAIVIYRTTRHDQAESLNGEPTDSDIRSALPDDEGQSSKNNLAPFDPNTADSLTLISYGLTPWQVGNMRRVGHFAW